MSLKSWFEEGEQKREAARQAKLAQTRPRARQQHYLFAHKMLPQIAFDFGAASVLMLSEQEKAADFLERVWRDCGEGLEGRDFVSPDGASVGLSVETRRIGNNELVSIVSLPTPEVTPEAYFVALMCDAVPQSASGDGSPETLELWRLLVRSTPVRVFTLELSQPEEGEARTVFCEWTSDGRHVNMGDGPSPDKNAFFAFLGAQGLPRPQASFDPKRQNPVEENR